MSIATNAEGGGLAALSSFSEIWFADFEFQAPPGERPWPVCMVAREMRSGRLIRLWRDELMSLRRPPFDCGPESLFVAYFASAELGCFLALGWLMPTACPRPLCRAPLRHQRAPNALRQRTDRRTHPTWPRAYRCR